VAEDDPKNAPGELELVRRFVNTLDLDEGSDELATPPRLRRWFTDNGLLGGDADVAEDDRLAAVALREAMRELLLAHTEGEAPPSEAVHTFNEAIGRAQLRPRMKTDGSSDLGAESEGSSSATGRLLAIAFEAMRSGEWRRLKVCRSDTCRWAFYDHSKNRSRHWCSMEACGSVAKARTYRRRQKGSEPAA
jgi:predicted RNA-binding Zn ribbon-like protein